MLFKLQLPLEDQQKTITSAMWILGCIQPGEVSYSKDSTPQTGRCPWTFTNTMPEIKLNSLKLLLLAVFDSEKQQFQMLQP